MLVIKSLKIRPKKIISLVTLISFVVTSSFTFYVDASDKTKIIYPLKQISKLKCRFEDFNKLNSSCKRELPKLKPQDYKKYLKLNGGYNEYTRIYTELWGASYKYGWDVGQGGHSGIDIATAKGTPVYNIANGVVILAKKDPSRGNIVSIKHYIKGKEITSNYAHLSKILVKKGQKIKVGKKIGEVGSTGNSTGNHLHFQIDLKYPFHPFYYSWKTCPYSYYKITETGVCFNELAEYTIDPLEFLADKGAVLDNIKVTKITKTENKTKSIKQSKNIKTKIVAGFDMNIFEKTVHYELNSSIGDVKKVQKIYKDLGYYKGTINGNYKDLEKSIIKFQIDKKIIKSKYDNGAGWFGPKTRAVTKTYYLIFLTKQKNNIIVNNTSKKQVSSKRNIVKIERKNILTREQIQEREINDFLKNNEIKFIISKIGGNSKVGEKIKIVLNIQKKLGKRRRKAFRGMLPAGLSFELNEKTFSVFPKKITHISNGKRDIILKGLKAGTTTLKIKLGKKVIKTFNLRVVGKVSKIYPKKVILLGSSNIKLGETKTIIGLFKDKSNKNMIRLAFNGTFILKTGDYSKVCIKKGSLSNIKNIYRKKCQASEFVIDPEISYKDTVGGILLFDIKATSKKYTTIKMIGKNSKKVYTTKNLYVSLPKDLNTKKQYYNETLNLLSKGVIQTNKGYFKGDNFINEKEALTWIEATLYEIKENTNNSSTIAQINKKLVEIKKDKSRNSYKILTRKKLLEKVHKYLVVNDNNIGISIKYDDLSNKDNKIANTIFDKQNTWKDKFGKNYFQPNKKVTKFETAFMLNKALNKTGKLFLTLK